MYQGKPFLELCVEYKFNYIIRYKEESVSSIKKNFDTFKIVDGDYQYQNEVIYGELKNKEFYTVNVITYDELDEETNKVTNFSYITNLKITKKNKDKIVMLGRKRWKIENKGFKEQKSNV